MRTTDQIHALGPSRETSREVPRVLLVNDDDLIYWTPRITQVRFLAWRDLMLQGLCSKRRQPGVLQMDMPGAASARVSAEYEPKPGTGIRRHSLN